LSSHAIGARTPTSKSVPVTLRLAAEAIEAAVADESAR
jgi:hypothetical protein